MVFEKAKQTNKNMGINIFDKFIYQTNLTDFEAFKQILIICDT